MELDHDEARYVLAYLMAGADGHVGPEEEAHIDDNMARRDVNIAADRLRDLRAFAAGAYPDTGRVMDALRHTLLEPADRLKALRFAAEIIAADEEVDPGELTGVLELADELDLDRNEVDQLLSQKNV